VTPHGHGPLVHCLGCVPRRLLPTATPVVDAHVHDAPDVPHWLRGWAERILCGSGFPNLPYAWDREIRRLANGGLPDADLAALVGAKSGRLHGLDA
jgi:hypothetical protein